MLIEQHAAQAEDCFPPVGEIAERCGLTVMPAYAEILQARIDTWNRAAEMRFTNENQELRP